MMANSSLRVTLLLTMVSCLFMTFLRIGMLIVVLMLTVADQQLRGSTDIDRARVVQWMSFADGEILPLSCTIVFPILGIVQYNKQVRYST